jgi:hypothetical protein
VTPSVEPLSPAATVTVTPSAAASVKACSIWFMAWAVHVLSGPPQLMDTIDGRLVVSWMAVVTASTNPWSVLGLK